MSVLESKNYKNTLNLGSNRKFGLVMSVFFLVLGFGPILRNHSIRLWPLLISIIFLLFSLFLEDKLYFIHKQWMRLGLILKSITTPVFLCILFFLVFTPIGLLLRLSGKDLIGINLKQKLNSNWKNVIEQTDFREQF